MKRTISRIILSSIIMLSGFHSFYQIDTNDLPEMSSKDEIQIKFENGKEINHTNIRNITITSDQELEIIKFSSIEYKVDSARILYPLNEIKELRIKKLILENQFLLLSGLQLVSCLLFLL